MSVVDNTVVAGWAINGAEYAGLYASDGSLALQFSDTNTQSVAISKTDQRMYRIRASQDAVDIYDGDGALITTVPGTDGDRIASFVMVPRAGFFWVFGYGGSLSIGASIYEYDKNGVGPTVITEAALAAGDTNTAVWSAALRGSTLYWVGSTVAVLTNDGSIGGRDYDGAIHKFNVTTLLDLTPLKPLATAKYAAVDINRISGDLFASVEGGNVSGTFANVGTDKVERYGSGDAFIASYIDDVTGSHSLRGLAVTPDGASFWVGILSDPDESFNPSLARYNIATGLREQRIDTYGVSGGYYNTDGVAVPFTLATAENDEVDFSESDGMASQPLTWLEFTPKSESEEPS